jgi:hypothetical protein
MRHLLFDHALPHSAKEVSLLDVFFAIQKCAHDEPPWIKQQTTDSRQQRNKVYLLSAAC